MSLTFTCTFRVGLPLFLCAAQILAQNAPASVSVDANADRHPISPNIYGFAFGATERSGRHEFHDEPERRQRDQHLQLADQRLQSRQRLVFREHSRSPGDTRLRRRQLYHPDSGRQRRRPAVADHPHDQLPRQAGRGRRHAVVLLHRQVRTADGIGPIPTGRRQRNQRRDGQTDHRQQPARRQHAELRFHPASLDSAPD